MTEVKYQREKYSLKDEPYQTKERIKKTVRVACNILVDVTKIPDVIRSKYKPTRYVWMILTVGEYEGTGFAKIEDAKAFSKSGDYPGGYGLSTRGLYWSQTYRAIDIGFTFLNIPYTYLNLPRNIDQTYYVEESVTKTRKAKNTLVGVELSTNKNSYPVDGILNNYRYVFKGEFDEAPVISGFDNTLGAMTEDFVIEYIVTDINGDDVSVQILKDGKMAQPDTRTTLGVKKTYPVKIGDFELGKHTIEIIATDSKGAKSTRVYSFEKTNTAPIISGNDEDLGEKNAAFSYSYNVKDFERDKVDVYEKLNGDIIQVRKNINLGEKYSIDLSLDKIKSLDINKVNTIEIEARDGYTTSYRRVTFIRNNMPPIISGKDTNLGTVKDRPGFSFSATDPEGDSIFLSCYLDGQTLKVKEAIEDNASQEITFSHLEWLKVKAGPHTIRIVCEDINGFSSERLVQFTKAIDRCIIELANKGIETDKLANRVFLSTVGVHVSKGAVVKYEVCNNSFDENPNREDATSMAIAGKAYKFQNTAKTAEKAGINIRVTIEKGTSTGQSYISAIGGSFD